MTEANKYFAHESAFIDKACTIGSNTKIWHFSHVLTGAVIGKNCNLGQNVVVHSTAQVGNSVKIQNNVSVYDGVILEDEVFCGPSMVFTNVINPRSGIVRKDEYKQTLVKRGATIGANATIRCGVILGEYSFVGAGAVVLQDVLAHGLVVGNPAKQRGWMCKCGIRLHPASDGLKCKTCNSLYNLTEKGLVLAT